MRQRHNPSVSPPSLSQPSSPAIVNAFSLPSIVSQSPRPDTKRLLAPHANASPPRPAPPRAPWRPRDSGMINFREGWTSYAPDPVSGNKSEVRGHRPGCCRRLSPPCVAGPGVSRRVIVRSKCTTLYSFYIREASERRNYLSESNMNSTTVN